jgi:hypothetical protein
LDVEVENQAQKQCWRREPLEKRRDGLVEVHPNVCILTRIRDQLVTIMGYKRWPDLGNLVIMQFFAILN